MKCDNILIYTVKLHLTLISVDDSAAAKKPDT